MSKLLYYSTGPAFQNQYSSIWIETELYPINVPLDRYRALSKYPLPFMYIVLQYMYVHNNGLYVPI